MYLRKMVVSKYEVIGSSDQLPAISLCYDLNEFQQKLVSNATGNLTFSPQSLLDTNISGQDFFNSTNETSIEHYLFPNQFCVKIIVDLQAKVYELSISSRHEIYYYVHSRSEFPQIGNFRSFFDTKLGNNLELLMTQITTTEISSRCENYEEYSISNRDYCLQVCISREINYFPLIFNGFNTTEKMLSNESITIDIGNRCLSKCSTIDCISTNFEIDTDYTVIDTLNTTDGKTMDMTLRLSNQQSSNIDLSYLFSLETYIVYIGSIIGAIYGLTVISLIMSLVKIVLKRANLSSKCSQLMISLPIYLLCILGCLYQVYQFSSTYFSYDIETETYMGSALGERILPAVSICHKNGDGQKFDFLNSVLINPGGVPSRTIDFNNITSIVNTTENFYLNKLECIKISPLKTQDVDGIALAYYVVIFNEGQV